MMMDKLNVIQTCNETCCDMDKLEDPKLSEISQSQKDVCDSAFISYVK